jgi:hypothetical protein
MIVVKQNKKANDLEKVITFWVRTVPIPFLFWMFALIVHNERSGHNMSTDFVFVKSCFPEWISWTTYAALWLHTNNLWTTQLLNMSAPVFYFSFFLRRWKNIFPENECQRWRESRNFKILFSDKNDGRRQSTPAFFCLTENRRIWWYGGCETEGRVSNFVWWPPFPYFI